MTEAGTGEPAEKLVIHFHVCQTWQRWQMCSGFEDGNYTPHDQDDNHDGRDFHDPKSLIAGFVNSFNVLPPEVEDGQNPEACRKIVLAKLHGMFQILACEFFNESGEILSHG